MNAACRSHCLNKLTLITVVMKGKNLRLLRSVLHHTSTLQHAVCSSSEFDSKARCFWLVLSLGRKWSQMDFYSSQQQMEINFRHTHPALALARQDIKKANLGKFSPRSKWHIKLVKFKQTLLALEYKTSSNYHNGLDLLSFSWGFKSPIWNIISVIYIHIIKSSIHRELFKTQYNKTK